LPLCHWSLGIALKQQSTPEHIDHHLRQDEKNILTLETSVKFMKIKPSALKNKTYLITLRKDCAIIDRCEPPYLKVFYYPKQKWGELLSVSVYMPDNFLQIQMSAAVQKAIDFTMKNIMD